MEDPGGRIWSEHPFAAAAGDRDPVRRFRGRLASAVTLWTAADMQTRAGLTVTSLLIAEPDGILAVVGADSDLREVAESTGRCVVTPLSRGDEALADAFAFIAPAPGGPFAGHDWVDTDWGPRLASAATWLGCRVTTTRHLGYGVLIEATVDEVSIGDLPEPLVWHHGRYRTLG